MITRPADGRDDSETTGLQHLGAREYDPALGRFISVDPVMDLADPQQMHGYTYGNNNPVTLSDPTGLRPDGSCGGSGACNVGSKKNPKWETWTPSRNGWSWGWSSSRTTSKKAGAKTFTRTNYLSFNRHSGYSGWSTSVSVKEEERNPVQKVIYGVGDAFYGTVSNVPHAAEYFAWPFDADCRSGGPGSSGCDYGSQFDDWIGEQGFNVDSATYQLPGLAGALLSHRPTGRGKGRSSSGCNSFLPQTAVLMADGTYKEIADVEVGDKVLATDPRTGKTAGKTVTAEIAGESVKSLVELTLDIDGDKGTKADTITATDGHPFWVPSLKSWVEAGSLKTGQELRSETGRLLEVTAVRQWSEWTSVRNLTVADLHTYYVRAGKTPVLVHNSNGLCEPGFRTASQAGISPNDARRIQNAADKAGQPVIVVGRANGSANSASDWDYILSGPSRSRHSQQSSLPRGTGDGEGSGRGRDFWQNHNPSRPDYAELDPSKPYVIFEPRIR
ncbi:polymorphic toxin-type HINT domain-containing protein [Streptomyces sp. Ru87]|uniref:polymorphic toxin-type HINT domain-containing protein n=1 Tax=Streptomyces sp. Ru87 TaxID=2044307 RepID=UPI0015D4A501|nr:polymorphic toxin-type HINT domain-containing protein [Streptomyces sp. Ru87]